MPSWAVETLITSGPVFGEQATGTLRRWIRESKKSKKKTPTKKGRPRTKEEIRQLIVKLARENNWGYTRIMGELKKLSITPPSRNTVKNILKEHDLDPGPQRGEGTWGEFLKVHAATLWQCDFYAKRVLTAKGWKHLYLLVFLHVGTRRVFVAPSTFHPNDAWVTEQAEAFLKHTTEAGLGVKIVMHDRDTKFTDSFDQKLKNAHVKVRKTAYRSPNTNAYVERFLQTLQQEALDHFIVFGQQHLDVIVGEFVEHYHEERPHQGMGNDVLVTGETPSAKSEDEDPPLDVAPVSQIACRERLGGVLKHYYRKAA